MRRWGGEMNNKSLNRFNSQISFSNLFDNKKHIVILGKPGAGKSSLIKYSISKILDRDSTIFKDISIYEHVPFRIELHKYNNEKKKSSIGIISYLCKLLEEEYQLGSIAHIDIETILGERNTILFFDGMDEIFDVTERLNVRNDIENISKLFTKIRLVVSSRYESYKEVSFENKDFITYEVDDFNDQQIKEYVQKWYLAEESDEKFRDPEIKESLIQLEKVDDELKRNPLLLSLILILYRNEQEIPTSKLEIYESCTKTLLDRRDRIEKGLHFQLKIPNKIATFSDLAYWQFTNLKDQSSSLTNEQVKFHIQEYLLSKTEFSDVETAEKATEEFLDFAKIRSIYFENGFTHKTFLEYFTAYYIYSNFHANPNLTIRDKIITENIRFSSWQVVLELLICKIDREQSNYTQIDGIVNHQLKKNDIHAANFLLQIIKYLHNISTDAISKIIKLCIEFCIEETSNSNIRKSTIFNYLISLYEINKFKYIFSSVLNEINKRKLNPEFLLSTYDAQSLKLEADLNITDNSNPNLFILKNYPNLLNKSNFKTLMNEFAIKYGEESLKLSYYSYYDQNIFRGGKAFSWIMYDLFSGPELNSLQDDIKKLEKFGITINDIRDAINSKTFTIGITPNSVQKYLNHFKKNSAVKKLLLGLQKNYFFDISTTHITNDDRPFYQEKQLKGRKYLPPR